MVVVGDAQQVVIVVAIAITPIDSANTSHDLHPLGPVALVHRAELVATATHPVRSNRLELHSDM